ncbi:MAG: hypothetical protein KDD53_01415 [Bdellovibrionales bacterium]|nr:hypothetical protein [Bdellovibrionales bacterium]
MKSIINLYWKCLRSSAVDLWNNLPILLGSILAYFGFLLVAQILLPFGLVGRFLLGFVYIFALTLYYGWLQEIQAGKRVKFKNLGRFDYSLFSGIISVAFLLFLLEWIVQPFGQDPNTRWVYLCVELMLFLLLNAIPEIVYIGRVESLTAIQKSAHFVQSYWIEWFLPLVLLLTPILVLWSENVLLALASADPLLPPLLLVQQLSLYFQVTLPGVGYLGSLIGVIIATWFMIFRAYLFDGLERRGTKL